MPSLPAPKRLLCSAEENLLCDVNADARQRDLRLNNDIGLWTKLKAKTHNNSFTVITVIQRSFKECYTYFFSFDS